jgi:hypothetical protein
MSITEFELLSRTFGAVLFGTILRSSLLAMIAAVVMLFFRSRTAELRHLIWSGVLYGLLILPVLQVTAPPLFRSSHLLSNVEMAILPALISSAAGKDIAVKAISQTNLVSVSQPFPWMPVASAIYIAITLILLVRLMLIDVRII